MSSYVITMKREGDLTVVRFINTDTRHEMVLALGPLQVTELCTKLQRTASGPDTLDAELDALLTASEQAPEGGEG